MNSCLYECEVMHHRLAPREHRFKHDIFMFYLDLDELDLVSKKIRGFSHNRRNLYSFRDADHEPAGQPPLKERLLGFLQKHGINPGPQARIGLLTLPRVAGYIFNPISVYYCFDSAERPLCAVAEVGNTFRERKLYLVPATGPGTGKIFHKITPKHFYVSPFSSLDLDFDFRIGLPGEMLDLHIDDWETGKKILVTTLRGRRLKLNNRNLGWLTLKYPLVTAKVILLIHWHALRLWWKHIPFYRKKENPQLQREILRPHSTLLAKTK